MTSIAPPTFAPISVYFKQIVSIILFMVSIIIPSEPKPLTVNVETQTAAEERVLLIEWENDTGKAIFPPKFYLEKQNGDTYEKVEGEYYFADLGQIFLPKDASYFKLKESEFGTSLAPGNYKVIIYYDYYGIYGLEPGQTVKEFEIK